MNTKEEYLQIDDILENEDDCVLLIVKTEDNFNCDFLLPTNFLEKIIAKFKRLLEDIIQYDPIQERSSKVHCDVLKAISCYQDILNERLLSQEQSEELLLTQKQKLEEGNVKSKKDGKFLKNYNSKCMQKQKLEEGNVKSKKDGKFLKNYNSKLLHFTCEHCEVSFTSSNYLEQHINACVARKASALLPDEQPLYCRLCNRSFSTPYNRRRHMVTHIINNKNFPSKKRLKMVDINQQDINVAARQLEKDNLKLSVKKDFENQTRENSVDENDISLDYKVCKEIKSDCPVDTESEEGEIPRNMSKFDKTKNDISKINYEYGEYPVTILEDKNTKDRINKIVLINNQENFEFSRGIINEEINDDIIMSKHNINTITIDEAVLNKPFNNQESIVENHDNSSIEKHKIDIISDHVLQKRKKYWSAFELTCVSCGQMFHSPDKCNAHMKENHPGEYPFICNYCDSRFVNVSLLRKHNFAKHKVEAGDISNIYLKEYSPLKPQSLSKKISIKLYSCRICHLEFNRADILKSHERRHLGIVKTSKYGEIVLTKRKTYKDAKPPSLSRTDCKICGNSYSTRANLKKHMAVHSEPKFSCHHCGKKFLKSDCLSYHLRIHTRERPWCCSMCPESFNDRRSWLVHLNNHKGLRPYKCEACSMSFVDRRHLNKHVSVMHDDKFKPKPVFQIVVDDGNDKQNLLCLLTE